MFDFGAGELLVIGIVALVVIGPKELPGVLRQVGKATGKMRQMAGEFRSQFDEAMREAELHEATKHLAGFKDDLVSTVTQLNPVTDIKNEIHSTTAMLNAPLTPAEPVVSPPVAVPAEEAAKPKRVRKKIGVGATDPSLESVVPAASPTAPRKSAAAKSSASTKADTARLSDTIPSKPRAVVALETPQKARRPAKLALVEPVAGPAAKASTARAKTAGNKTAKTKVATAKVVALPPKAS